MRTHRNSNTEIPEQKLQLNQEAPCEIRPLGSSGTVRNPTYEVRMEVQSKQANK